MSRACTAVSNTRSGQRARGIDREQRGRLALGAAREQISARCTICRSEVAIRGERLAGTSCLRDPTAELCRRAALPALGDTPIRGAGDGRRRSRSGDTAGHSEPSAGQHPAPRETLVGVRTRADVDLVVVRGHGDPPIPAGGRQRPRPAEENDTEREPPCPAVTGTFRGVPSSRGRRSDPAGTRRGGGWVANSPPRLGEGVVPSRTGAPWVR